MIHKTFSAENTTDEQEKSRIKTQVNTISTKRDWSFLPVGFLILAGILVFGAWFNFPLLMGKTVPKFQSIQVSQLTNNGKAQFATVSPDGNLVAFVNVQDGKRSLFVRQISADSAVEVVPPTALGFYQPAFSPDGQFVYYVLEDKGFGTLFRVATLGRQSKKIASDVDSKIAFSPDGKQFAFIRHNPTDGGSTIFIAQADGSNLQPFIQTKELGYDKFTSLSWSPDNKRLLLGISKTENEPSQKIQIATVELNDKTLKILGDQSWFGAGFFEWLNDGTGIVFVGKTDISETSQIWHISYPSGEFRQISADTTDYASLSVSSDGNIMVATKKDVISSIWSYAPGTKELKQLTGESRILFGGNGIAQMPDGKILYTKKDGKEINIFAMDESGSSEKQLTAESGFNANPISTPDGRFIIFNSNRSTVQGIWRMNADGSNAVRLTNPENAIDAHFQATNDSKNIIFARQKRDGSKSTLMKVSIEGGEPTPLLVDSKSSDLLPRISPDGKNLAYQTLEYDGKTSNFKKAVKVLNLNGATIENSNKETELSLDAYFRWSPDSKSLTYVKREDTENLWSISLADKKEKPITEFNSGNITNFTWSRDGKKLFIVRGIVNSDLILVKDSRKSS